MASNRIYSNNYSSFITSAITDTATTLFVNTNTNLPTISGSTYFYLTLDDLAGNIEIVKVTAWTSLTLTIVRAQESTTARAWGANTLIELRETAGSFDAASIIDGAGLTAVTVASSDLVLIQDVSDSNKLKVVTASSLGGGGGGSQTPWASNIDSAGYKLTNTSTADGVTLESNNPIYLTSSEVCVTNYSTSLGGAVKLMEASTNGTNYITINAPASLAGNNNYTLPTAYPATNGYVLTCATNGVMSWGAVAIADANYGDVTVSSSGNVWTVNSTSTPSANAIVEWDSNSNLSAKSFLAGYTSVTTAANTTTLTAASTQQYVFTGSTTHTCALPAVSTLALGRIFTITNLSSGVVTVISSGGNTVQGMAANTTIIVQSNATSGANASVWNIISYNSSSMPKTAFFAYLSANQSISGSVYTKAQINTEAFDTGSLYDNSTNYRYTPNVKGKYIFFVNATISSPSVGDFGYAVIYKNGAIASYNALVSAGTVGNILSGSVMLSMNGTTDYTEFYVQQTNASAKNLVGDATVPYTYFAGYLVERE